MLASGGRTPHFVSGRLPENRKKLILTSGGGKKTVHLYTTDRSAPNTLPADPPASCRRASIPPSRDATPVEKDFAGVPAQPLLPPLRGQPGIVPGRPLRPGTPRSSPAAAVSLRSRPPAPRAGCPGGLPAASRSLRPWSDFAAVAPPTYPPRSPRRAGAHCRPAPG